MSVPIVVIDDSSCAIRPGRQTIATGTIVLLLLVRGSDAATASEWAAWSGRLRLEAGRRCVHGQAQGTEQREDHRPCRLID